MNIKPIFQRIGAAFQAVLSVPNLNKQIEDLRIENNALAAELVAQRALNRNSSNFAMVSKNFRIEDLGPALNKAVIEELKPVLTSQAIDALRNIYTGADREAGQARISPLADVAYDINARSHVARIELPAVGVMVHVYGNSDKNKER